MHWIQCSEYHLQKFPPEGIQGPCQEGKMLEVSLSKLSLTYWVMDIIPMYKGLLSSGVFLGLLDQTPRSQNQVCR